MEKHIPRVGLESLEAEFSRLEKANATRSDWLQFARRAERRFGDLTYFVGENYGVVRFFSDDLGDNETLKKFRDDLEKFSGLLKKIKGRLGK